MGLTLIGLFLLALVFLAEKLPKSLENPIGCENHRAMLPFDTYAYPSPAGIREMKRAAESHDQKGIAKLMSSGQMITLTSGTEVVCIEGQHFAVLVHVLDGADAGKAVWLPMWAARRLWPEIAAAP